MLAKLDDCAHKNETLSILFTLYKTQLHMHEGSQHKTGILNLREENVGNMSELIDTGREF